MLDVETAVPGRPWIIALTGASGTCYARRLIELLLVHRPDMRLEVVASEAALRVMREEEGLEASVGRLGLDRLLGRECPADWHARVTIHSNRNIGASIASGSYRTAGMVVVPCSMRTLAAISNGIAENLIQRAADVVLKEKRPLVIVPRETPLSVIHLENMLRLARLDVRIVPAMPGFYTQPKTIGELVDQFVLRIADQMGIELPVGERWGETREADVSPGRVAAGGD